MLDIAGNRRRDIAQNIAVYSGGDDGGGMDEILKRLGAVETSVSEIRTQVSAISAVVAHLATKAEVAAIAAMMATKTEVAEIRTDVERVRTDVASMESAIIKWTIATVIAVAGMAFAIAKFVH